MKKNIIFKCNSDSYCGHGTEEIITKNNEEIFICYNYANKKCKYKIPMMLIPIKYQCWFMNDKQSFIKCTGTLREIRKEIKKLFKIDKYGVWGNLQYLNSDEKDDYIVKGTEINLDKLNELITLKKYSDFK